MRTAALLWTLASAQVLAPHAFGGEVTFDFQSTNGFAIVNFLDRLSVAVRDYDGERAIIFKNEREKCESKEQRDTYWSLMTPRFNVQEGKTFAVKVRTKSDIALRTTKPMSSVQWYRADGKELLAQDALGRDSPVKTPMPIRTSATSYRDSAISGRVPEGAAFAKIRVCSDLPNLE